MSAVKKLLSRIGAKKEDKTPRIKKLPEAPEGQEYSFDFLKFYDLMYGMYESAVKDYYDNLKNDNRHPQQTVYDAAIRESLSRTMFCMTEAMTLKEKA